MSPSKLKEPQRIAKLLARAGIASRREIERMIAEGRVALDGTPLATPATVLATLRGVTVDGKPVAAPPPARLFVFHKPPGLLTAERDPRGRRTIYDALPPELPRLVPVGRLDLNTEGLLLMTTDGGLKRTLELPATGVERSYRARAFGQVSQAQLEELIEGITIDGIRYGAIDANLERRTGANVWIELTLTEGKNREVRRVLEYLGLQVSRLIRTRYGPFVLGDLPPGAVAEIRQHDLVAFRKAIAGPGGGKAASNLQFSGRAVPPPAPEQVPSEIPPPPANRAERRKRAAASAPPAKGIRKGIGLSRPPRTDEGSSPPRAQPGAGGEARKARDGKPGRPPRRSAGEAAEVAPPASPRKPPPPGRRPEGDTSAASRGPRGGRKPGAPRDPSGRRPRRP